MVSVHSLRPLIRARVTSPRRPVAHPSRLAERERAARGLDGSNVRSVEAPAGTPDPVGAVDGDTAAAEEGASAAAPTASAAAPTAAAAAPPAAAGRIRRPAGRRRIIVTALAMGVATASVFGGSFAAWTASTTNTSNSVAAGTLTMSNNKDATSVFAATNVAPGDAGSSTVAVANTGSLPMSVGLLQDNVTATGIEASLGLKIHDDTRNSAGGGWCYWPNTGAGACATYGAWNATGTFAPLALPNTSGGLQWAAAESHTFTISWTLLASSPNSDQGKTGSFRLNWSGAQ